MITACFARRRQRCTDRVELGLLFMLQEVSPIGKTRNQLSEKITDVQEIGPALKRGLAAVDGGKATVLEFITCDEGEYSKFSFR